MRQYKLIGQRLVIVFLLGLLLFFSPVLRLFDREELLLGLPVLYVYLFGAWFFLIAAMAWIVRGPNE